MLRITRVTVLAAVAAVSAVAFALLAPTAANAATAQVADEVAPVASYSFDGDSGSTVVDSSGNGNDATWVGTPSYVTGQSGSGQAAYVNGGTNYLKLPLKSGQTDGSGSFSVEFWIDQQSADDYGTLLHNQDFAHCYNPGITIYQDDNPGDLQGCFGGGAGGKTNEYPSKLTPSSVTGSWHQFTIVVDRTSETMTSYEDGVQTSQTASGVVTSASNFDSGVAFTLGDDSYGHADAYIDDFNFYDAAITAAQVQSDYAAVSPLTVTTSGQGTATASPVVPKAGDAVTLSEQAAAGYHFAGWQVTSPADGSVVIGSDGTFTMPGTPVTVQATFTPNGYTVHYDGNGADGGAMADGSFTYDQSAALAADAFTRTGYQFIGWATTAGGAASYSDGASVSNLTATDQGTVTLYASWAAEGAAATVPVPDVLNVDFASGKPVDHAQSLAAATIGSPTVAADATLGEDVATFDGSSDAYQYDFTGQYSKLTTALSLECEFRWNGAALSSLSASAFPSLCSSEQSGGVNIEVYNNKLNASIDVGGYEYAYASADAVVPGQWYDAIATWDGQNLKLYLDGRLVATTAAAGALTLPATVSQRWTLGGDVSSTGGVEAEAPISLAASRIWSTPLTAAQVVAQTAASTPQTVTVMTSGQGTASTSSASALAGSTIALTQQAATGYHFAGWQVTAPAGGLTIGADGTFTMPAAPVAVSADFEPNGYTVHFDGNGAAAGTMSDESFSYDQASPLTANAFTRPGYGFAGWAVAADSGPKYADGASVSKLTSDDQAAVTLYAAWIPAGENLVAAAAGAHGTAATDQWAAAPGDTVTLSETPDTGYHFTGWAVAQPSDGSLTVASDGAFAMPDQAVSVSASFAPNTYTVTFDGNGADEGGIGPVGFSYDEAQALPANGFVRDGYRFTGWSTTADGAVAYHDAASVSNLTETDGGTVTLYAQWAQLAVAPGSWGSLPAGFVSDTFKLPAVQTSSAVDQQLAGLWNGAAPTAFTKASGDGWLSVSSNGIVTGTAPADVPQNDGEITVLASNGTTTSQILVEVPVRDSTAAPQLQTASWNAWSDGSQVTDAVGKNLAVIAARGIGVIGFQDGGGAMAQQLGAALGWSVRAQGDLGIVSAYPFTADASVLPTDSAPALAATIAVDGTSVRLWDVHLDEADSGPDNACFNDVTDPSALVSDEKSTARYAQAQAVEQAMAGDVAGSTPVVMLGDLASPSSSDWTAATAGSHCDVGAVDWPVPDVFAQAGLHDSYRTVDTDPTTDPGTTWSPIVTTDGNGQPEPQDRVDYVDYTKAGGLKPVESETLTVGWPSATDVADNSWASDHAAVVTTFAIGDGSQAPAPIAPTVSVGHDTVAYQVGDGPADEASFLSDVGAASDDTNATLSADLSDVDATTPGWYTAIVTASDDGVTSDPVAVKVRVAPVPGLALGSATARFTTKDTIDEATVLAQLEPVLDVDGATSVDLSQLKPAVAGSYPVTVTPTDTWGFDGPAQQATVVVTASATSYTIAFDPNGGSGSMTALAAELGASVGLPTDTFTRTGYTFAGWATSADGAAAHQDGATVGALSADAGSTVTLYAVWTPVAYTIGYDLAGGSAALPNPVSYTIESPDFTLTNPTRDGYAFAGWTGTGLAAATKAVTIATGSTGDRSYTAGWTVAITPPAGPTLTADSAPAIPKSLRVGQLVTATPAIWQGGVTPSTTSYQWLRDGKAVAGASGRSYRVAAADAGQVLSVVELATATGFEPGTSTSNEVRVARDIPKTATPPDSMLPQTGSDIGDADILGGGLLGLGAVVVAAAWWRRRRKARG